VHTCFLVIMSVAMPSLGLPNKRSAGLIGVAGNSAFVKCGAAAAPIGRSLSTTWCPTVHLADYSPYGTTEMLLIVPRSFVMRATLRQSDVDK
jgi:hypothetical protein